MKKAITLLLASALVLTLAACTTTQKQAGTGGDTGIGGLFWDILHGERGDTEKPQAIIINIENHTGNGIADIAMSWSQDGKPLGSRGMEHADHSLIPDGDICRFDFLPEDFASAEPNNLRFDVYVGQVPHEDYIACGGFILEKAEYGTEYSFELRFVDGSYSLRQLFANGSSVVMPLDIPVETIREEAAAEEALEAVFDFDPLDLTGPWHVDPNRNNLTELANRFGGYGEFGAIMELRGNGQMSWYIGAEGGAGTYSIEGTILTAEVTRAIDDTSITTEFAVLRDGDELYLCMHDGSGDVYWSWGDDDSTNLAGEEIYPGKDVVELVNLRGDKTTAYKLADGTYMDRASTVYIYDGIETWTDKNGAEWNEAIA